MGFAADWARRRNVPLICNEFGAYREHTKADDRARWIAAVRTALEKNHIGWTMWDYRGGFGVVHAQGADRTEDTQVLEALGDAFYGSIKPPKSQRFALQNRCFLRKIVLF